MEWLCFVGGWGNEVWVGMEFYIQYRSCHQTSIKLYFGYNLKDSKLANKLLHWKIHQKSNFCIFLCCSLFASLYTTFSFQTKNEPPAKTPWSWGRMLVFCVCILSEGRKIESRRQLEAIVERIGNKKTSARPWTTINAQASVRKNRTRSEARKGSWKRDLIQRMWIEERERKNERRER